MRTVQSRDLPETPTEDEHVVRYWSTCGVDRNSDAVYCCKCGPRWIRCDCGARGSESRHVIGEGVTFGLCDAVGPRRHWRSVQTVCTRCGTFRWWWESWTGGA